MMGAGVSRHERRGEIARNTLESVMYETLRMAATELPPDVEVALRSAQQAEWGPLAREHLRVSLKNAELARENEGLVCGDTGYPLFFIRVGRCDAPRV